MSFGNELKAAREAQGLGIQDLAQRTKIRGDYLRALEAEDLSGLPERTFSRAYVQRYARELQLDAAPLLRDFDRLSPQPPEQVNTLRQTATRPQGGRRARGNPAGLIGGLVGGVLLLALAGYLGYSAYQSRSTVAATATDSAAVTPSAKQVRLSLSSTPAGARVYLDNHYLGLTPLRAFPLDARAQGTLRVEYGGRQTYQQPVDLQSDRNLNISLTPMTAAQLAAQAAAAKAAETARKAQAAAQQAAQAATQATQAAPATPATASSGGTQAAPTPPVPTTTPSATTAPATTPATGTPPVGGVRLSWTGASWTRVTSAGGQVLYEGIPTAGTTRDFPSGIRVRTGSAGLVTATVGSGQPQKLGGVGQVVTRTF